MSRIPFSYLKELKDDLVSNCSKSNLPSLPVRNKTRQSVKPIGLCHVVHSVFKTLVLMQQRRRPPVAMEKPRILRHECLVLAF